MPYKILADMLVFVHFLWILFLIFGSWWGRRHKTIKRIHVSGLVFALMLQVFDWYCPLTYLEVWLRARHDPGRTYSGSFIIHYIERVIYPEVDKWAIVALTVLICLVSAWVYHRGKRGFW